MSNLLIKPGDWVVYKNGSYGDSEYNPLWGGRCGNIHGQIINIGYDGITVLWDNGKTNGYNLARLHLVRGLGTDAEQHIPISGADNVCIRSGRISTHKPPRPKLKLPKDRKKGIFNL